MEQNEAPSGIEPECADSHLARTAVLTAYARVGYAFCCGETGRTKSAVTGQHSLDFDVPDENPFKREAKAP